MFKHSTADEPRLPLVVQLGFAGSRRLFDPAPATAEEAAARERELVVLLKARLLQLREDLGLSPVHFFCGLSQIAIGGDTVFTRALMELGWPQRIFLPQPRDQFLSAESADGVPDFSEAERAQAEQLLQSGHVIQERPVSDAADRRTRFEDVNREIARVSDVMVCLLRADASGRAGGTQDLVERGRVRGTPVLELHVRSVEGRLELREQWHGRELFEKPRVVGPVAAAACEGATSPPERTSIEDYCRSLKSLGSRQAQKLRDLFKMAELIIHGTHLAATVLALFALLAHGAAMVPVLLGAELAFLAAGFTVHSLLHHSESSRKWAAWRLVAELARSVLAVGKRHLYLDYLFVLPFPPGWRSLLRTISVLHLQSTRGAAVALSENAAEAATMFRQRFEAARDEYLRQRIQSPRGQIAYYREQGDRARVWRRLAQIVFWIGSGGAILMTTAKLLVLSHVWVVAEPHEPLVTSGLGALAVLLPLAAVAALALAEALDIEARASIYPEMRAFLERQLRLMTAPIDAREFDRLLLETETRLLGETVNWYARRSYLS